MKFCNSLIVIMVLLGLSACRPSGSKSQAESVPALEETISPIPNQEAMEKPDEQLSGIEDAPVISPSAAIPAPELPDKQLSSTEETPVARQPVAIPASEKPEERLSSAEDSDEGTDAGPSAAIPALEMLNKQISGMKEKTPAGPSAKALEALKKMDEMLSKTKPESDADSGD